jgi:hypothetical protein
MESSRPVHDFATCGCMTVSKPSSESLGDYYARKRATAATPAGESAVTSVVTSPDAALLGMPETPTTFQPDQAEVN